MTSEPTSVAAKPSVSRLLNPRAIAIVGASPTPGALGDSVLRNLDRANFAGDIHLINPKRSEIRGRACVASVMDLPYGVDCAVLAIPRAGVLDAVRACAAQGVGGVIIFSAGFAENGEAGRAEQEEIAAIARAAGMVVEGPNCLGLVNHVHGAPLTFIDLPGTRLGDRRGVAIVSQSGAMAAVVGVALHHRSIGVSYSISTGNEAATGVEDFVEHLLDDPDTSAILLVVEQFRNPGRFLDAAARCREAGKPLILLHPGHSAAARKSAETHTGAMAGDDAVMRLKVRHAGVALVETLEELLDLSELVARCPAAPRAGAAVLTDSGFFKAMTLDFCEAVGLELPALSEHTHAALRAALPEFVPPSNPLDLTAQGLIDPGLYRRTLAPLLDDDAYGSVVLGLIMTNEATSRRKLEPVLQAVHDLKPGKPIIVAALDEGAEVPAELVAGLRAAGAPFFPSPERAYRALSAFTAFGKIPPETVAPTPIEIAALPAGTVPEYASKRVLAELGIPIPPGGLARSVAEAQAVAARIGYPVVLKAQSSALSHKSDAGGVALNLGDDQALADGWAAMHASVAAYSPGLALDGVLVEAMGRRGIELIIGARNDPDWGPVILAGFGGVQAEAMRDVRLLPPNLAIPAIVDELHQLKSAALLRGFRGSPAADVEAAAAIIARLGSLMQARPDIVEVDINPVVVYPSGRGALALDALMIVRN
jgi:acyl-CoA synthetase (NDP forming)